MKRALLFLLIAVTLCGCSAPGTEFGMKVRRNEVIWNNGLLEFRTGMDSKGKRDDNTAFRAYVRNQEGKTVQMPADTVGLGYGASCPMGTSGLYKPGKGISGAEILLQTQESIIIHLRYDNWRVLDAPVSLDKQITLFHDSPIMAVIDYYAGEFELLNVAAGLATADNGKVTGIDNGYAVEYPDGITGIIVMPEADEKTHSRMTGNVMLRKGIGQEQILRYYVGLSGQGLDYLLDKLAEIL